MRVSAEVGSPWLPVVMTTTSSAGVVLSSLTFSVISRGKIEVAALAGHLHVVHHAAAGDEDLPARHVGRVDDLLDARDQGREGCDDDAAFGAAQDLRQGLADHALRRCVARHFHVCRVGQEQNHALVSQLRQSRQVRQLPHHRRVVQLEVSRVDHDADRRVDGVADRVRHAVRHLERLYAERRRPAPSLRAESSADPLSAAGGVPSV